MRNHFCLESFEVAGLGRDQRALQALVEVPCGAVPFESRANQFPQRDVRMLSGEARGLSLPLILNFFDAREGEAVGRQRSLYRQLLQIVETRCVAVVTRIRIFEKRL